MQFEFRSGDEAEIPAASSDRPKQVGVFLAVRAQELAVRRNNVSRLEIFYCQSSRQLSGGCHRAIRPFGRRQPQSYGDCLSLNPHIHAPASRGVWSRDGSLLTPGP